MKQWIVQNALIASISGGGGLNYSSLTVFQAFTLAEVLITLTIIGVVAAMTMPVLKANKEKVTVVQVKKAYSMLEQALEPLYFNGPPASWISPGVSILDVIEKEFKVIKKCAKGDTSCVGDGNGVRGESIVLANGQSIFIDWDSSAECNEYFNNVCAQIYFDVNGSEKPNKLAYDQFLFLILKDRVVPRGLPGVVGTEDLMTHCLINNPAFSGEASSCTAWVIVNENMDYLHCYDLSWDSKTTCR